MLVQPRKNAQKSYCSLGRTTSCQPCTKPDVVGCPANGFGLGEGGVFTTNVDAENQCLINHKTVCHHKT